MRWPRDLALSADVNDCATLFASITFCSALRRAGSPRPAADMPYTLTANTTYTKHCLLAYIDTILHCFLSVFISYGDCNYLYTLHILCVPRNIRSDKCYSKSAYIHVIIFLNLLITLPTNNDVEIRMSAVLNLTSQDSFSEHLFLIAFQALP